MLCWWSARNFLGTYFLFDMFGDLVLMFETVNSALPRKRCSHFICCGRVECWYWQILNMKVDTFRVICHILISCHCLFVITCDVTYTRQSVYGHRCVAISTSEVILWGTDRPKCVSKCLKLQTCRYINHNYGTGQCKLGLDKCEFLAPAVGIAVNAFWATSRHLCALGLQPRAWTCAGWTAVSWNCYIFGTNNNGWYFGCWKVPCQPRGPLLGQQWRCGNRPGIRNRSRYWISHHGPYLYFAMDALHGRRDSSIRGHKWRTPSWWVSHLCQ